MHAPCVLCSLECIHAGYVRVVKINERAQTAITCFFALTSETLFLIIFVGLSVNINPRPTVLPVFAPYEISEQGRPQKFPG